RAALPFFVLIPLCAQPGNGTIRLDVKDPSDAAVEASGKLKNLESGAVQAFRTDAQGRYTFQALPFGRYRIEVSKNGFATQSATIDVQSETPVVQTMTLALETKAYRVDVVATTPLPGTSVPLEQIPVPVQVATAQDVDKRG